MHRFLLTTWVLLLGSLALGGCSSINKFKQPYDTLAAALQTYERGAYGETVDSCEGLLAATANEAKEFAVQRFYAQYLLVKAHAAASAGNAFLREPRQQVLLIGGQGASDQPSETGHMVATVSLAGTAIAWAPGVSNGPWESAGQAFVPAELRAISPARAADSLRLACLTQYSRLGFFGRVNESFGASREIAKLAGCQQLLAGLDLPRDLEAWTYLAVHRYLRSLPNREVQGDAYQFAMQFLHGNARATSIDPEILREIDTWVTHNQYCTFRCPACQKEYVGGSPACRWDPTPVIAFVPVWKSPQ